MVLCPPLVRALAALVRGFRAATCSSSRSSAGLYLGVCPIPWPKIVVRLGRSFGSAGPPVTPLQVLFKQTHIYINI